MLRLVLCAGFLGIFLSQPLAAQESSRIVFKDMLRHGDARVNGSPDLASSRTDSEVSLIIQFEGHSLLAGSAGKDRQSVHAELQQRQELFQHDLSRIALRQGFDGNHFKIKHSFYSVYNGTAITVPESSIAAIQQLPYVKQVVIDGEVTAARTPTPTPFQSRYHSENATIASPFTGEGIVVAIIDSGIDYRHAALGGGMGPGYRVIGGYDFINNDEDPWDDHGHGTHVAGIVGGNADAFKGMAPDTRLIALKVLNRNGLGKDSAVLRALEYAVNPDGDPVTDDAVDIINMSLSSLSIGTIDHPVTVAVEAAIAAGVVCVVAAGNRGEEGRATITAPGNAPRAVTVGASNGVNELADFSSQGPSGSIDALSEPYFGLKPDLLAPGVDIESTWPGGGYRLQSGTSMAAPYITGAAARVLEQYPDWTPEKVKAWLIQHTRDIGTPVWTQGAGVFDEQLARSILVSPASIDYGLVFNSDVEWVRSSSITLSNLQQEAVEYAIKARAGLPAGVTVTLSTDRILLASGESSDIVMTVQVNPQMLPAAAFPEGYIGYIDVESQDTYVAVPFSFFKPERAHLSLSAPAERVILREEESRQYATFDDQHNLVSLFVPPGEYDIIAQFDSGRFSVIREHANLEPSVSLSIDRAEAATPITFRPLDVHERALIPLYYETALRDKENQAIAVTRTASLQEGDVTLSYSHVSNAYTLDIKVTAFSEEGDYYEIPFSVSGGVSEPQVVSSDAGRFKKFVYNYDFAEDINTIQFVPWSTRENGLADPVLEHPYLTLTPPFKKVFYTMPLPDDAFTWKHTGHSILEYAPEKQERTGTLLQAPPMTVRSANTRIGSTENERLVWENEEGHIELFPGARNIFWAGKMDNSPTRINVEGPVGGGLFRGEWGEVIPGTVNWTLSSTRDVVARDTLVFLPGVVPDGQLLEFDETVQAGAYELELSGQTGNTGGVSTVRLAFKTDRADADPPAIKQLYNQINELGDEELILYIVDSCGWCSTHEGREQVASVQFWTRPSGNIEWVEREVSPADSVHRVSLTNIRDWNRQDYRVRAVDVSGNTLEYTYERSTADESTEPVTVSTEPVTFPDDTEVEVLYPNPVSDTGKIRYTLGQAANVEIIVYDILGRRVLQKSTERTAGTHEQLIDFSPFASGIYVISLSTDTFVDLQQVVKVR